MIMEITKISQVTQEVTFFLRNLGFSNYYIIKIFSMYGDATISLIEDNPYFLLEDFPKIGFKRVDDISIKLGNDLDNEYRVEGGIKYILNAYLEKGDTYVEMDTLLTSVSEFLEIREKRVEEKILDLTFSGDLQVVNVNDKKVVYYFGNYKAECDIAKNLKKICDETGLYKVIGNYKERIKQFEENHNLIFSENQKLAILSSISSPVSIITGGPGTGKTTVINSIVDIFKASGMKVALAAPTGRASKRMMEVSKNYSETIHRLLGYYYDEALDRMVFKRNKDNPLSYHAIIIDEASMIDLMLMNSLLQAIQVGTRIIFVGDKDQLPSVGAGNVLSDLIESDCFPVTKLNLIYRQDKDSDIIISAHKINEGQYPTLNEVKDDIVIDSDLVLYRRDSQSDISDEIVKIASSYSSTDVQVLSPIKKGKVGTIELNERLHEIFNPKSEEKAELPFGKKYFRVGDRVMQNKNNYRIEYLSFNNTPYIEKRNYLKCFNEADEENIKRGQGVFNGEIGIITDIDKEERSLVVLYDDERYVKYEYINLDEIEHAYAITIHKSQGSEFPVCIIPMTYFPTGLTSRSLIYTGLTRGKKKVIIVGNPDYLYKMVDNNYSNLRKSGLMYKIVDTFKGL